MSTNELLAAILEELSTITILLQNQQSLEYPQPIPTEFQVQQQEIISTPTTHPTIFDYMATNDPSVDQPPPPELPSTKRAKWTPELEQLIHTCSEAKPLSYANSMRWLIAKLPFSPLVIRNKANKMGYRIQDKHLLKKEAND